MDIWLYPSFILTIAIAVSSQNVKDLQQILKRCDPGDITENEYNKCICTPMNIYECFPKPYNATMRENALEEKPTCIPDTVYTFENTTCICSKEGFWPHTTCERTFRSQQNDTALRERCKPNSYMKVNCNMCKCGDEGYLDKARCTKNECKLTTGSIDRRFIKQKHVYGSCEAKTWYSLAPCQLCYCIGENKLVCNSGNSYPKKIYLGTNSFSICGQRFIKDALSLVPGSYNSRMSSKETQVIAIARDKPKVNAFQIDHDDIKKAKIEKPLQYDIAYTSESYEDNNEVPLSKTDFTKGIEEVGDKISGSSLSEETDNEINLDVPSAKTKKDTPKTFSSEQSVNRGKIFNDKRSKDNEKTLGDVLKPYLPVMLDKVFHMSLRKSLAMDDKAQCTPGTTNKLRCNTCFCLKNNKLLCTNYKCD